MATPKEKQTKKEKTTKKNKSIRLNKTAAWQDLKTHYKQMQKISLNQLFAQEKNRGQKFSLHACDLFLDYSKNNINTTTLSLLQKLLSQVDFKQKRQAMFEGKKINFTEERAVLHVALRNSVAENLQVDGENVKKLIDKNKAEIKKFVEQVHSHELRGFSGKPFRFVVNIGIGGSDLGTHMVTQALAPYSSSKFPQVFFVSNVDGTHIRQTLEKVNIEETLFLIASKTFTTQETMTNALTARDAVMDYFLENKNAIGYHFVALSTNITQAIEFGIKREFIFGFWDWVGGRFSLWSAIGLPIALSVGWENFTELLLGAHNMDEHFLHAPPLENMPVILALLSVWYNNFFNYQTHAVLPYEQLLSLLPSYLQQAEMESNGKYIGHDHKKVDWQTSCVLWGEAGTNGQHAFYQLIHQGTKIIPCDFIGGAFSHYETRDHHLKLIANLLAQPEALMRGKNKEEVLRELKSEAKSAKQIQALLPHKVFLGNRPSNTLLYNKLTPRVLGALIALYEHKIFTEGVIWGINSFDQWGVELGKKLASNILQELKNPSEVQNKHDSSTASLLHYIVEQRKKV